jgi:hypothetical protein
MKLIKLTSHSGNSPIYINIDEIGHFNEGEVSKMNSNGVFKPEKFTTVGVTTHNNGGFKVKETPEEILEKIRMIRNTLSTYIIR